MRVAIVLLAIVSVVVGLAASELVKSLQPPTIQTRTVDDLLATPFGEPVPAGSLELRVRYTQAWVETTECEILCARQYPHCALVERAILTNDPDAVRERFFAAARQLGWTPRHGPFPYRGVNDELALDRILARGIGATLTFVDLDRPTERASAERSLATPLDARVWRYLATVRFEDTPPFLGGRCDSTLWRVFGYPITFYPSDR